MLPLKDKNKGVRASQRRMDSSVISTLLSDEFGLIWLSSKFDIEEANPRFLDYLGSQGVASSLEITLACKSKLRKEVFNQLENHGRWTGSIEIQSGDIAFSTPAGSLIRNYNESGEESGFTFLYEAHKSGDFLAPSEFELLKEEKQRDFSGSEFDAEARMRYIGNLGTDGFWDWDLVNNVEYLSPSFKALFGYEDHEMPNVPESWQKIIFEEDRVAAEEAFVAHTERGEPYNIPVRYRHKDGSTVHVLCRGAALKDENGEFVRMVGTHTDITRLKETEAELRRINQNLEQLVREKTNELIVSQVSFKRMAESVPVFVWRCTAEGVNDYLSPKWSEFTGQTTEETRGYGWLDAIHPGDQERVTNRWKKSVETGIPMETEYRLRRHDGEYRWFAAEGLPNVNEDGEISAWFGASRDIHKEKLQGQKLIKHSQMLEKANRALEQSNSDLEQFARVASHDLQEPLRMVVSFADILKNEYSEVLDERGLEYLEFLYEGGQRMQDLINDVLTYSRVDTQSKDVRVFEPALVLEDVVREFSQRIQDSGTKIQVGEMPPLKFSVSQFSQILKNLLSNSIKFVADDPPFIEIWGEETDDGVEFHFKDNGIGIDEKHHDRIFLMFQRLHSRKEYEGTGIGLAIVKKIIDNNYGRIEVQKGVEKGAHFIFFINHQVEIRV